MRPLHFCFLPFYLEVMDVGAHADFEPHIDPDCLTTTIISWEGHECTDLPLIVCVPFIMKVALMSSQKFCYKELYV